MKRVLYIYNPNAGRQRSRAVLSEALETIAAEGFELTVVPTAKAGDAAEAARLLGGKYHRVVCCGGDGTLNEVVSGLLELPEESRPVVGYIPMGSANDFSRSMNLPKSIAEQARLAVTAEGKAVDMGCASGRTFTYVSAFGLFTEVSYATPQSTKNILGHFAYLLEGAGSLTNIPSYHMTVTAEGRPPVEGDFIYGMAGNTLSLGGVVSLPKDLVQMDDGLFEVVLVRRPRTLKDWQGIASALAGLKIPSTGAVEAFSANRITFRCDKPVAWTVDGEYGGTREETETLLLPGAIRIAKGK